MKARPTRSMRWLLALCAAQAGTLLVFLNFAGALPLIQADWQLSNAEAGAIQAATQFGYVIAVLVLSSLTDYVGAEWVMIGGAIWAGVSNLAFATLADSITMAVLLRTLTGLGIAGLYMPGVRLISQHVPAAQRGRALGLFVASFTLGSAGSLALSGSLASVLGWRPALALLSLGPFIGAVVALPVLWGSRTQTEPRSDQPARSITELWHNQPALLVIATYTAHAWELLGLRGWLAAFLAAALAYGGADMAEATRQGAAMAGTATVVGALSNATTATLSDRIGRTRTIMVVNAVSFLATLLLGFTLTFPWLVIAGLSLLTVFLSNADSAVISTTLTETVPLEYLGRTLGVYSFLGFTAGSIAPLVFGFVLDHLGVRSVVGGEAAVWQWGAGFATLALGSLVAFCTATLLHRRLSSSPLSVAEQ